VGGDLVSKGVLGFFVILGLSALFSFLPDEALSAEESVVASVNGRHIFEHYCAVCHGKAGKGDGVNAKFLDPHPANLAGSELASRSDDELYEVIAKGGAGVDLAATMPPWGKTFSSDQIKSLVVYVRQLQKKAPSPRGARLSDLNGFEKEQCSVCHSKQGKPRQIAPNLGHEGSKVNRDWLFQFLKNPTRIRPSGYMPITKTRMPNFNFNDEDAGALTEYLMTLKEDRFGAVTVLDQSEKAVAEGEALFSEIYGCDGCHKVSEKSEGGIVGPNLNIAKSRLTPEWIYSWLKHPQAIRPDSPMPNFGLPESDIRYLMAYILSLGGETKTVSSADSGRRDDLVKKGKGLVEKKNCLFCHILESSVGVTQVSALPLLQKKGK